MSDEPDEYDEEIDGHDGEYPNPFEALAWLGYGTASQDSEPEDDDDWDDDVYVVSYFLDEFALGDFGAFPVGIMWDGSLAPDEVPQVGDLRVFQHVRLVVHMRCEERRRAKS